MDPVDFFGLRMQQSMLGMATLAELLNEEKPARVIELGTGAGGLSLLLESWCLRHGADFATFDRVEPDRHVRLEPVDEKTPSHEWHLGSYWNLDPSVFDVEGCTLLLCDGGDKPGEVRQYAPMLQTGDIIGAHDYCVSLEVFRDIRWKGGWRSCEVTWADIEDAIAPAFEAVDGIDPKCGWGFWRKVR